MELTMTELLELNLILPVKMAGVFMSSILLGLTF